MTIIIANKDVRHLGEVVMSYPPLLVLWICSVKHKAIAAHAKRLLPEFERRAWSENFQPAQEYLRQLQEEPPNFFGTVTMSMIEVDPRGLTVDDMLEWMMPFWKELFEAEDVFDRDQTNWIAITDQNLRGVKLAHWGEGAGVVRLEPNNLWNINQHRWSKA